MEWNQWIHRPSDPVVGHTGPSGYYYDNGYGMNSSMISQQQQYHSAIHMPVVVPQQQPVASPLMPPAAVVNPGAIAGLPVDGRSRQPDQSGPCPMQQSYSAGLHDYQYPCLPQTHMSASTTATQHQALFNMHCNDYPMSAPGNSNRMMRNMAEKNRRDKLNAYINDLATLVPMVSNSSKKMDKTSVLRLSATFLRMNQLVSTTKSQQLKMPQFLSSINWSQLLLDDMDGVMLIVTSAGKIVFISPNIEKLLGHTQLELFGQSIFNITCLEDHSELKKCLAPDEVDDYASETEFECDDSRVTSSESINNSACSSRSCASRCNNKTTTKTSCSSSSSPHLTNGNANPAADAEKQRRSFYLRLRQRCVARSEQPQYELVHVVGYLRVPKKLMAQAQRKSRKHKADITTTNSNEILLVAIMKPFRERRITQISLMEATSDEYITRHSLDGRIIYSDHRISVVSGYLFEEVSGLQAFNFMHRDDVCWVLIALRQMFWRSESYGSSCYRLKSKTGAFIYLKTHGYLELNANSESYSSFICVNTLLSAEEGEREIEKMRKRFSVLAENNMEPALVEIAKHHMGGDEDEFINATEDPVKLKSAIKAMITNIPTPVGLHEDPEKSKDSQFAKAKLMSKVLPPSSQVPNIITFVEETSSQPSSASPQSITCASMSPVSQSLTSADSPTTTSSSVCSSQTTQNRPSVLRLAPSLASRQPVTVYNGGGDESLLNTRSGGENLDDILNECDDRLIKQELAEEEEFGSMESSWEECSERTGVLRRGEGLSNGAPEVEDKRAGVVVGSRPTGGVKRHYDSEKAPFSSVPNKRLVASTTAVCVNPLSNEQKRYHGMATAASMQSQQQSYGHVLSPTDGLTHLSSADDCNCDGITFGDIDAFETKAEPELQMLQLLGTANEDIKHNHVKLESRMHLQGAQINAIENDIDKVSFTSNRFCLQADLGKLKEEHSQQEKLLMSLRQDHFSLQHCNTDNRNVSNIHSNVEI